MLLLSVAVATPLALGVNSISEARVPGPASSLT